MAFPTSPSNDDLHTEFGRTYRYVSETNSWTAATTPAPENVISTVTAFESAADLPLVNNNPGDTTFVAEDNSFRLWTGNGWFEIALANTAPTITAGANASYTLNSDGTPTVITMSATDPEGTPIVWGYQVTSGSLEDTSITNVGGEFTITPGSTAATFGLTFTASDGVNIDTSASLFTLEFVALDTTYIYNQMLVKASSTVSIDPLNITTDDRTSSRPVFINRVGTVSDSLSGLGAVSPYYPGLYSYHTYGTTFTIQKQYPSNYSRLYPGTGDFTFECWYMDAANSTSEGGSILFNLSNVIVIKNIQKKLTILNDTTQIAESGSNTVTNTRLWNHYAISRQSGTIRIFLNGVLKSSTSSTLNLRRTLGDGHYIYGVYNGQASTYMTDVRWVVGTAVYTNNFDVPTAPLEKITGTQFLLSARDNTRTDQYDGSDIDKSGDYSGTSIAFSPYSPEAEYDPDIHSGSVHLANISTTKYAHLQTNPDISIGTQDYTVECWVYLQKENIATTNDSPMIFCLASNAVNSTRNVISLGYDGGAFVNQSGNYSTGTLPNRFSDTVKYDQVLAQTYGKWYHFALCRHNGTRTLYVNGVARSSAADTYDFNSAMSLRLFKDSSESSWEPFTGYMSDFRLVVGNSVYTTDFTPPTQKLTEVAGTEVLLNFNKAGIIDSSGMQNLRGTAVVSNSITKHGDYSMYFDGTTFFQSTWIRMGEWQDNEYTIEAWIYPLSVSGLQVVCGVGSSSGPRLVINGTLAEMRLGLNTVVVSGGSIPINEWTHIVSSRVGTTTRMFVNGIQVASTTAQNRFVQNQNTLYSAMTIGGITSSNLTVSDGFNGYIENPRVKLGAGKYSSDFTPPTAPFGFNNAE